MIKREHYISKIRPFYDSDLIKIITGIRRSGKSVIMKQIMEELEKRNKKCLFIDFDIRKNRKDFSNADLLISYVENQIEEEKLYVFLDEIQNVDGWNEACRTLRLKNCSVFITGSNSKLLSREFTKELSGRYVSFEVRPFIYKEAKEYADQLKRIYSPSDYLVWGGFPASIEYDSLDSLKTYLNDLNDTIIYNDLENRYNIRKKDIFERVVDYVLVCNSRKISARSICDYMKSQHVTVSIPTVIKYISYLEEAYVIKNVSLYSSKSKSKLNYYYKIYDEDVSFNSLRATDNRYDLTHNIENIVYNELIYRDYEVTVFNNDGKEIDFRVSKNGKTYLVQVAYSVVEEKAYNREFSAFDKLDNSIKKIIITNDDVDYSTSTVEHIKFSDFLLLDDLL